MCGVVGFWNKDGRIASEVLLERMLERIEHRGPDDKGTWAEDTLGLAHCRLSILDLSPRGHQPFVSPDQQGILSYNGEIYNYRELRHELQKEGVLFRSETDTEVFLHALQRWGPRKAVPLFNGMFAFAYYDKRNKALWLARDKTGIKPLYLAETGSILAFASEIKALHAHPAVPCRPDLHALTTHIVCQRLIGTWSPFENVTSLTPGTILKITSESKEAFTYFDVLRDLQVERLVRGRDDKDPAEFVKNFEEFLSSSVKAHLASDAPLAAMCSGGVDSSLMTAYAKDKKADLVAYVADMKGTVISEGAKAQRVCRHLGVELRQVDIDKDEYLRLWPQAVYHNDQPNFFPQNVPFMAVSRAARRDGFKVMLTGEGSDELFGGYDWHVEAYRMWRMRRLHMQWIPNIRPLRVLGRFVSRLAPLDLNDLQMKPFTHLTQDPLSEKDIRLACAVDGAQRFLMEKSFFKKLEGIAPLEQRAFLASSFGDFYGQLPALLRSNDKMGMAHSIEARVPFLENRLIDFGLHLPCTAKFRGGITKWVVKKAAEKRLPADIVYARKIGFGVPNSMWRSVAPFLKGGIICDLFKWGEKEAETILSFILKEDLLLFHLLNLELWARIYLRGESPAELGEQLLAISQSDDEFEEQGTVQSWKS